MHTRCYLACPCSGVHPPWSDAGYVAQVTSNELEEGGEAEAEEEERMGSLAVLGRARAAEACAFVSGCLRDSAERMRRCASAGACGGGVGADAASLEALHEECELLIRLGGHLLTDGAAGGDAAEVPIEIGAAPLGAAGVAESHPAVLLTGSVFEQLRLQLELLGAADDPRVGPLAPLLSPLVAEALLWFVGRIVATYLMPDEGSASARRPCARSRDAA